MFSSIVAPSGAFSPNVYFVPSGAVASFPSASLYVGASVVTASPAFPSLSAYVGVRLSASFCATLIGAFTLSVVPSEYFTTTGISTVLPASASTGVYVTLPSALTFAPAGAPSPNS